MRLMLSVGRRRNGTLRPVHKFALAGQNYAQVAAHIDASLFSRQPAELPLENGELLAFTPWSWDFAALLWEA